MSATVTNSLNVHQAEVMTNGVIQHLQITPKTTGRGSSVNGGELLLLALATCYCNDLYREANKRNITIDQVEVICSGEFGGEGEPGYNFQYSANIQSNATSEEINPLLIHTDAEAEIHNTLRKGIRVELKL